MVQYKNNSLADKVQSAERWLQRLIDTPVEKWTPGMHDINAKKPLPAGKGLYVDILEGKVILCPVNDEARMRLEQSRRKNRVYDKELPF